MGSKFSFTHLLAALSENPLTIAIHKKRLFRHAAVITQTAQRESQGWPGKNVFGKRPTNGLNGASGCRPVFTAAIVGVCRC
jgi:hypothetical protein